MRDACPSGEQAARLVESVKAKYRAVAREPTGQFPYKVGRKSALRLGYEAESLDAVAPDVLERFVGVGNPFRVRRPARAERVLDVGCGAGLDAFVASLLVGREGRVVGIDPTPEMLDVARRAAPEWAHGDVELVEASAEKLPFADAAFDVVLTNGVLNLVPDKDAAFREIARVLRPGGVLAAADLLVVETVPDDVLADMDAWSA